MSEDNSKKDGPPPSSSRALRPPSSSRAPPSSSSRAPPPPSSRAQPQVPTSTLQGRDAPASPRAPPPSSSKSPSQVPTTTLQGRDSSRPPPAKPQPHLVLGSPRVPMSMMPPRPSAKAATPRVLMSMAPGGRVPPPPPRDSTPVQANTAPTTMLQGRDALSRPPKVPTTTLQGRDTSRPPPPPPATMLLGRDKPEEVTKPEPEEESESDEEPPPPSMFKITRDDIQPLAPAVLRSVAPASVTRSVLDTDKDAEFAAKQLRIEELEGDERLWQDDWAYKQLLKTTNCPEMYDWIRVPGGYQCEGGGHGVSDALLAEGKGGILATKTREWSQMDGPYYPNPNGEKNFIRGVPKPKTPPPQEKKVEEEDGESDWESDWEKDVRSDDEK